MKTIMNLYDKNFHPVGSLSFLVDKPDLRYISNSQMFSGLIWVEILFPVELQPVYRPRYPVPFCFTPHNMKKKKDKIKNKIKNTTQT